MNYTRIKFDGSLIASPFWKISQIFLHVHLYTYNNKEIPHHSTQSNFSFVARYGTSKITHTMTAALQGANLAGHSWVVVPEPGHRSNLSNTQSVPLYHLNRQRLWVNSSSSSRAAVICSGSCFWGFTFFLALWDDSDVGWSLVRYDTARQNIIH